MDLRSYKGEYVSVLCSDGEKIKVSLRIIFFPEGNEPEGMESIILDGTLELTKSEIAGIAQIERGSPYRLTHWSYDGCVFCYLKVRWSVDCSYLARAKRAYTRQAHGKDIKT